MLLFNEQNEQLNILNVKADLQNLGNVQTPSLDDLKTELGNYYNQALQLQGSKYQFSSPMISTIALTDQSAFLGGIGGKILAEIKKIICSVLNGSSTSSDILDAVLNALSAIIPGGIFIKTIAEKLVKYLLSTGITAFCAV